MTQPAIQEQEINLQRFLLILRRRYPYLIAIFLVTILLAGVSSSRQVPLYKATALLIFEPTKQSLADFANIDLQQGGDFLAMQKRIITSRKVISRVLAALNLPKSPPKKEARSDGTMSKNWIKLPNIFPTGTKRTAQPDPVKQFGKKISVQLLPNTHLIQLQVTDPDPDKAALYVNTLAQIYIAYTLEDLRATSNDTFTWLSQQVTTLKAKVQHSEMDLLKYTQAEELTSIDKKQSALDDKISELNNNISKLALQRLEKESILQEIRGRSDKLHPNENLPALLETSQIKLLKGEHDKIEIELARISSKFKKNHPERIRLSTQLSFLKQKISAATAKAIRDLEIEYHLLQTKEEALKKSLLPLQKQAHKIAEQAIEYGELQQEADANKQLYSVLLEKLKKTDIGNSITSNNIRILDKAEVPQYPSSPNAPRSLLLAGVLGLFLGAGSCFLLEYFDNTITSQDDLELLIGMDLIGAIPERKAAISLGGEIDAQVSRGYQETKNMLDFYRKEHLLKTLLVTSTLPKEGKTSTVLALGQSYAQAGAKVLMVDGDFFKPGLTQILGLPNESGLFTYLYKEVTPSELIRKTPQENLFLLPTGLLPPNPTDWILSEKMQQLLHVLAEQFDLILVDTPPVMASNAVAILASSLDGVAFIVRAHSTSYQAATTALKALEKVNVRPLGAVLTRTRKQQGYGYDYGYGYGKNNSKEEAQQAITPAKSTS
ncbi:MAG: polysaccharide biosynthesis tyrosine autokinase [Candidatus Electrothrix sp. GW3-4]|uniref:GumC family protein n=1 Tax=Candidatus Electrothrix sp. GW3-4 TaxID=3126740 RepID=UPI0030D0D1C4